ncbi:MAG: CPBP family intramembrane metalloprotease [Acidobacteria bacterium]|nr:CPBP family intramembrane metalloprotease [Acidobacteriota bacterium]
MQVALSFARCAALTVASQATGLLFGDSSPSGAALGMMGPVAVAGWVLHRWNVPLQAVFSGSGAAVRLTPWIAAGDAGHLLLLSGLTHWLGAIWPWFARSVSEFELPMSGPPAAVAMLLAVGAPVTEELLFRGVLLRGMLARYPVHASVAGTACLFAASHWFPVKALLMLPAGVFLGWLYVRYRSVWPPLLAHAFNNSAGAWLILTAGQPKVQTPTFAWWQGAPMVGAGTVLLWASYQCLPVPAEI